MNHSVLRGKNNLQSNTQTFTHNTKKKTIKLNNFESDIVAICSYNFVYPIRRFPIADPPPLHKWQSWYKICVICAKNTDGPLKMGPRVISQFLYKKKCVMSCQRYHRSCLMDVFICTGIFPDELNLARIIPSQNAGL